MDQSMLERGQRFERLIREAMARQGIPSLVELARETHTTRDSWYEWFRGDREPRRATLVKATAVLGLSLDQMMAPWDGGGVATLSDEALRVLVQEAVADGVAEALRRIAEGPGIPERDG